MDLTTRTCADSLEPSNGTTTMFRLSDRSGWNGDQLGWESRQGPERNTGRTTHYLYEPGTFVSLAQAVRHAAMKLLREPVWEGEYDFAQDPLWRPHAPAQPFDTLAHYQCDHLGTPQELTDASGEVAWSAHYRAWGEAREVISQAAAKARIANPLRFQGQYFDHETGLHYNRHRYYDPHSGRFVSKDPIGLAGGFNVFAYVGGNPMTRIDPTGLDFLVVTGGSRERSNPFGHTALGVTGAGMYSYGNNTGWVAGHCRTSRIKLGTGIKQSRSSRARLRRTKRHSTTSPATAARTAWESLTTALSGLIRPCMLVA